MSNTQVVSIQPNADSRARWSKFLKQAEAQHWRKILVTIRFREMLHAGKPAQLDAANAMLRARGLEAAIEAVNIEDPVALAEAAETTVNEGLCEFLRRQDKPGMWFPANNVKAMLKENWGVLGYRMDARPVSAKAAAKKKAGAAGDEKKAGAEEGRAIRGSRGALAEGVFVVSTDPTDRDYIYIGEKPTGIDQSVAHTMGPKGPQASIKRNEYVLNAQFAFEIWIAKAIADKIPDESLADVLLHAGEHGLGANRSQGKGRFDVLSVEDLA